MELSSVTHIDPDNLADARVDLFICTLSQEQRSIHIPRLLEHLDCRKAALVPTQDAGHAALKPNLDYLRNHGFEIIPVESDEPDIDTILGAAAGGRIDLLVDCTSMSQRWYYEFLRWFDESQGVFRLARLRFTYTMAAYVEEDTGARVKKVSEFLKRDSVKKRSGHALILGLGHEPNVAEAICRTEHPDLLYLFYADPPVDKRFVEKLFVNNHRLIHETPIRNLVTYPISNGQIIYQKLIETILPLRNDHHITVVPWGPKIFSLAAMLVHLGYPDVGISYPVFKKKSVSTRDPSGQPVVLDVVFEAEE